jgi:hypothetical protein
MRALELTGEIGADRTVTPRVPPGTPVGPCRVSITVQDQPGARFTDGLVLFHDCVLTDPTDTFRRETLYGDDE